MYICILPRYFAFRVNSYYVVVKKLLDLLLRGQTDSSLLKHSIVHTNIILKHDEL